MTYSQDWFTPNIPHLAALLHGLVGRDDVRFLEVGCFEGRSTVWFLENILTAPSSTITCVDTFRGSQEHESIAVDRDRLLATFRANVAPHAGRVRVLEGESRAILRSMPPEPTFDMVYIDGSHRAPDVLSDAVLSWPLVLPGGLLVFDDYAWRGEGSRPRGAIDAFLKVHRGQYELLLKKYQVAIRRLPDPAVARPA